MKKQLNPDGITPWGIKLNLKMKLSLLFLLTTALSLQANPAYSQKGKITLNLKNVTVSSVIDEIEANSKFKFIFKTNVVNLERKVSINANKEDIGNVLNKVFKNTKTSFEIDSRKILLYKSNKEPTMKPDISSIKIQRSISGIIIDEEGQPLPGASIVEKGTTNGITTDFDGNFTLNPKTDNPVLVVSYIGYSTQEINVGDKSNLTIKMEPDSAALEEVIVVGYGTQKKETVTGAVTAVKGAVLEASPAVSVSNSLAGRLPGVVIVQTSGEPGNDESTISIRGTNTIGNNSPLVVIDGIPDRDGGIARLNALDIENISVLKDASAAIYGARAANGAIIVTTKQGRKGKPTITYDADFGMNQPTILPKMASSVQYADIVNELRIYNNIPSSEWGAASTAIRSTGTFSSPSSSGVAQAVYSPEQVAGYNAGQDDYLYPNTDWFGDVIKDWALQSRHNLSISGGGDKVTYFASLGYQDQDAYYKNSANRYQQYNFRINTTAKVNDYVKAKLGFAYRKEDRRFPTQSSQSIFRMLMRGRPTEPAIWPTGEPGPDIENGQNPVVIATNSTGYDSQPTDYLQFTGSVDIENPWVKGLKVTLLTGVDQSQTRRKLWETPWSLYSLDVPNYIATGNPVLTENNRAPFTSPRLT